MTTVIISLKKEDQRFIESAMKQGRYVSESELIAEGISELRVRENVRAAEMRELQEAIHVGVDQADRRDFVEFNAEEVIAERHRSLAQA